MIQVKRLILPVVLSIFILAAVASGIWFWYDNNVDRSGWIEEDGVRFYQDFHADPVSGWLDLAEGRYYFHPDGTPHTGWQEIDGTTYYFDETGIMTTGWLRMEDNIHYFGTNGALVDGWLHLGESVFYFRDGCMVTGWQEIEESLRYFQEDGVMVTGFSEIEGDWYYFDNDGIMASGMTELDGQFYNFQDNGVMFTGWEELEGGKRYFHADGAQAFGWQEIDGNRYFFDQDGLMYIGWLQQGEYSYYLKEDGSAAVGPTVIDGLTHYFTPKGIEVILVNALNSVPRYYDRNLVNVTGWHDVDRRCYDALVKMLADCNAAGIEYNFNSAYRTIEEQTAILEARTQEHMANFNLEFEEARKKALETVAYPGTSEHHLGLAVDLLGEEAIAWFTEHCWDYGFIVRYTKEKEFITGIVEEPWHFRYVGTAVSLDMKDSGLCLEEYLGAQSINWYH